MDILDFHSIKNMMQHLEVQKVEKNSRPALFCEGVSKFFIKEILAQVLSCEVCKIFKVVRVVNLKLFFTD